MKNVAFKGRRALFYGVLGGFVFILTGPLNALAQETVPLSEIAHIHAIATDPSQPDQIYLATHKGLFVALPDGQASRVSKNNDDLMGFVRNPKDGSILFASGHPPAGGNLGVLKSVDGGKSWNKVSDGLNGPVDFHAMAISPIDTNIIYGVNKTLQVSIDGGKSWKIAGKPPAKIFDIAASARDANTVFAATRKGLYRSMDKGETWRPAHLILKPVTMVNISPDGEIYAFFYGLGLLAAREESLDWKNISSSFQDRFLWRMVADGKDANKLYAVADTGVLFISKDGGKDWASFENHQWASRKVIEKGRLLFENNCQACHGKRGVGERPKDMYAKDDFGFVAPPLNDSGHAWHHSDRDILQTIAKGSARNERMIAWKDILSREDRKSLLAYIKSLWNFNSIACQGVRHMSCMN